MDYLEFLKKKEKNIVPSGFEPKELNRHLFPFQDHIVRKALKLGKYALFEDCGLGKTIQQLSWGDAVVKHTNKPVLLLAPLAVGGQTILEGEKFGIEVKKYNGKSESCIQVLNYEQLDNIVANDFSGIICDESSILKNYEGKIKGQLIELFNKTPYKLPCTATPSPNDPMELGNHSEFLNAMSRNEMLAMYFVHDGGETAKWRLKGHSQSSFWKFVSEWAVMLSKPSDIGFNDEGYNLPPLNFVEHQIETRKRNNGLLFNEMAISATNFNQELRFTKEERLGKAVEIVKNNPGQSHIIWIKQNEEEQIIKSMLPEAVIVTGSDKDEVKEERLLGFAKGQFPILVTKTKIAQFGLNYQNCNNQVFASLDFSFEGLYQAIRRSYRFGQKNEVNISLISTDTMTNVIESIKIKQRNFELMQKQMTKLMNYKN